MPYQGNTPDNRIRRYTHEPARVEFKGVTVIIRENGQVTFIKVSKDDNNIEVEDELTVPATVVFMANTLLKAGRKVTFLDRK